jgi:peptide/nickel transport system ATP-binding protein
MLWREASVGASPAGGSSLVPTRETPVLSVRGLRVETSGGREIVDQVEFDVFQQEVLALVGESGCGKTATALALLGHVRPGTRIAAGSVSLAGDDILTLPGDKLRNIRGAKVSYIPQDPASGLNPRHRIGAQISEVLTVHGVKRDEARDQSRDLIRRVHLPDDKAFLARYPFELSGGQKQRVAIAMALVSKPLLVVLDEPTTGLDVTTQARVLDLLRELSAETQTAFVYVTHDLAVVDGIADRVAVMYAGRIVEEGPREAVFGIPAHPYTTLLLRSVPRIRSRRLVSGITGTAPAPGERPAGCFFAPRCPLADARCAAEMPAVTIVNGEHTVRCWHAIEPVTHRLISRELPLSGEDEAELVLLRVEVLMASYGRGSSVSHALNGVSLSIQQGRCLAVVGESGSGKTTLGRCIAGLHRPDSGQIKLNGSVLGALAADRTREERRKIQIVFQNPDRSLNPTETVAQAIGRVLALFRVAEGRERQRKVLELLSRVRLPSRAVDRYPGELSGGEKQRVAIARALAAGPDLLVCDEITSALDVSIQAVIVELLDEFRRDGLALLFITHNLALVNSIADYCLVLQGGYLREEGDVSAIIDSPRHEYTRELLSAAPELRSGVQELAEASSADIGSGLSS